MQSNSCLVWEQFAGTLVEDPYRKQKQSEGLRECIDLIHKSRERLVQGLNIDYHADLDKPFLNQRQLGLTWHKSWIIPKITVTLKEESWKVLQESSYPHTLKAELLSVVQRGQKEQFEPVPFNKNSTLLLQTPKFAFMNLKFSKTSFQYCRQKFRFLLLIYGYDDQIQPKLFLQQLSSSIYVDSRRRARLVEGSQQSSQKKPKIDPDLFFKPIQTQNGEKWLKFQNSASGFLNYYTAPNIRNKIKDPFYIAYHFSNLFRCFIDHRKVLNPVEAIKRFQGRNEEDTYLAIALVDQHEAQAKKIKLIIDKFFKESNVNCLPSIFKLKSDYWECLTRKEIHQAYRNFFEDQEDISSNSEQIRPKIKSFEHRTEITLQKMQRVKIICFDQIIKLSHIPTTPNPETEVKLENFDSHQ